ncbi:MAG: hypothetical protein M1815_003884 [Lichina confinis]|nr:MAG: hypothetical protein M1815_003884 [Lichina confinis]
MQRQDKMKKDNAADAGEQRPAKGENEAMGESGAMNESGVMDENGAMDKNDATNDIGAMDDIQKSIAEGLGGARLEDDARGVRMSEGGMPPDAEEALQRSDGSSRDPDTASPTLVGVKNEGSVDEGVAAGIAPGNADGHGESLMRDSREQHRARRQSEIHDPEPQGSGATPELLQFEIPRRRPVVRHRRSGRSRRRRHHDQTVDNVAAGLTDSALTCHGVLQTERLGAHFVARGIEFTKIFSSDLQRAYKTAEAIRSAQPAGGADGSVAVETTQLPLLREKDFGPLEGVAISPQSSRRTVTAGDAQPPRDAETKEAMAARADEFLDNHLLPLLEAQCGDDADVMAVVSHGIFLGVLWRALMHRFPPSNVSLAAGVGPNWKTVPLEHLGGWSNTGYLELDLRRSPLIGDASSTTSGGGSTVNERRFGKLKVRT